MGETDWAPDFAPLTFRPDLKQHLDTRALSSIQEQEHTPRIRTRSSRLLHMRASSILSFASTTRKEQRQQQQQTVRSRQASSVYMPDIVSTTDDVSASSSDLNAIVSKHTFEEAVAHGFDMDARAMEYLPQLPRSPSIMDEMKSHLDLDSDGDETNASSEFGWSPSASPVLYSPSLTDAHHRQMTLKLTLTPAHIQTSSLTTTAQPPPPPLPRRHSKLFRWQKHHAFSSRA